MRSRSDSGGTHDGLPYEFTGAKPWIDMNDAQKNAHAEEMSAHAAKIRAEAQEILIKHPMVKLKSGVYYFLAFATIFAVGFFLGFLTGNNWSLVKTLLA